MKRPIIVWSDPPAAAPRGRRLKHGAYITALRERPGQWACLTRSEDPQTLRSMQITLYGRGYKRLAAPYALQLRVRATGGGDYGLWARVVEKP